MPREDGFQPRVKRVTAALVDLFMHYGSVNAVRRALNDALGGQTGSVIYPNRIHTLLSGDPSRGVNTATLDLLERFFVQILLFYCIDITGTGPIADHDAE